MPPTLDADLERWIAAFRGPLVGLLASWGCDWRAAEEVAQDTLAEAWVGQGRLRGDRQDLRVVGAWLRGIAWNLFSEARRREGREPEALDPDQPSAPTIEPDERRERLLVGFAKLSASHQAVLRMHYLEETGAREVAALLGVTQKAVEDRLYQARRALRAHVERAPRPQAQGAQS